MTNYPSTPTIEIDPRGDVLLQTPTTSFLVASKCLTLASPVFSAMLHGHFLEASSLSTTGSVTISVDDDPEILCIIFNILHYRHRQVPSSLTSAQLLELAVVADKYDLADAIHPAYLTWRGDPKTMGVGPGVPAPARIFIAWVFRDREWFYVATRYTLLHCCLEEALEEGRWGGEGEVDEEDGFSDAREGKHDDEEEEDEEEPESEPYHDDPEQSTPTQSSPNQRRKRAPDQPPRKHGRLCIYNSLLSEMTPPIPDKVIGTSSLLSLFPPPLTLGSQHSPKTPLDSARHLDLPLVPPNPLSIAHPLLLLNPRFPPSNAVPASPLRAVQLPLDRVPAVSDDEIGPVGKWEAEGKSPEYWVCAEGARGEY
ncbi:hypothetical protein EX30DRAFT_193564 [Ascodesmis nigricans]|uniref:BTB domain-containing protein n=1 Tax=Ascodesmis nigricans TaxID=341454 RepID=A0A4S2N0L2_9PEZI|nr:hypothetical protein EX30DRAFT_193564 [Ascodesmis nigricans]